MAKCTEWEGNRYVALEYIKLRQEWYGHVLQLADNNQR
jgi:hypothetical protein